MQLWITKHSISMMSTLQHEILFVMLLNFNKITCWMLTSIWNLIPKKEGQNFIHLLVWYQEYSETAARINAINILLTLNSQKSILSRLLLLCILPFILLREGFPWLTLQEAPLGFSDGGVTLPNKDKFIKIKKTNLKHFCLKPNIL